MTADNPGAPDAETLALAHALFDAAREGNTALLAGYLSAGAPAAMTNAAGDSLLMLAAYHGHVGHRAADPGTWRRREHRQRPRPDAARRSRFQGLPGCGPGAGRRRRGPRRRHALRPGGRADVRNGRTSWPCWADSSARPTAHPSALKESHGNRRQAVAGTLVPRDRVLYDPDRHHHRLGGQPQHHGGPQRRHQLGDLGDQRLPARLRRAAADHRPAGRPLRPEEALPVRASWSSPWPPSGAGSPATWRR